jgi:ATP-dependent exoDNAse (exonuclease V) beta subunit
VAVHAALAAWLVPQASRLDRRPLAPERSALLELGRREAERIAREESSSAERPALLRAVPSETARILEGFLGSSLPARLTAAEILGVEVPILFRDPEGGTWTGACDLLIAEGGSVVVADFKTDQVVSDAPAAAERHRSQLGVYVEAVRRVLPRAGVRGEVLFVRTGESVVLFPGAPDAG